MVKGVRNVSSEILQWITAMKLAFPKRPRTECYYFHLFSEYCICAVHSWEDFTSDVRMYIAGVVNKTSWEDFTSDVHVFYLGGLYLLFQNT